MLDLRPKTVVLLAILALVAGLIAGLLWFRAHRPVPPAGPPGPTTPAATKVGRVNPPASSPPPAASRPVLDTGPGSAVSVPCPPEEAVEHPQSRGPESPTPPADEAESWEFTRDDLAAAVGRTVSVELGEYRVRVGDVFDVRVILDAPPLQAVVLAMKYDPEFLEPVQGSAVSIGPVFRKGVEFFARPDQGRMALFCATYPGKKNVLAAVRSEVARFKLRAKQPGTVQITADSRGMKCITGSGEALPVDVTPAEIVISGGNE